MGCVSERDRHPAVVRAYATSMRPAGRWQKARDWLNANRWAWDALSFLVKTVLAVFRW